MMEQVRHRYPSTCSPEAKPGCSFTHRSAPLAHVASPKGQGKRRKHLSWQAPASGSTKGGSVSSSPTGQEALGAPSCLPWCLHMGHSSLGLPIHSTQGRSCTWGKPGCCNELQNKPQQTHRALAPEGLCSLPAGCRGAGAASAIPHGHPQGTALLPHAPTRPFCAQQGDRARS